MQSFRDDVAEIGTWQGRQTFFLGIAVKYSGNGRLFEIDPFMGILEMDHTIKLIVRI